MNEIELTEQFMTDEALIKRLKEENEKLKEGIKEAVNYAKELKEVDDLSFSCDRPDIDKWLERWGE